MDDRLDLRLLGKAGKNILRYADGDVIFREGDAADVAYVVRRGTVEIRLHDRVLDSAGPGILFGEMALIDPPLRSADAVAVGDVTVTPVTQLVFFHLIGKRPEFTLTVLKVMARRIKAVNAVRNQFAQPAP